MPWSGDLSYRGSRLSALLLVAVFSAGSAGLSCSGQTAASGAARGGQSMAGSGASDSAGAPDMNGGGATAAAGGAGPTPDANGYAKVPGGDYPPLLRRVTAVDCSGGPEAPCASDDDCGQGKACICGSIDATSCAAAECRTDADCESGACLLSRGPDPHCCGSGSVLGLFCARPGSTCERDFGCPGSGQACVYVTTSDLFECRVTSCSDC